MRRALAAGFWLASAVSLALCLATVVLWVYGRRQSVWLTHDTAAGRHLGAARFADGVALYFVPSGQWTDRRWSVWETSSTHSYDYVRPQQSLAGFHFATNAINPGDVYLVLPYWAVLAATAAVPVARAARWARTRRRTRHGHCPACGYDLTGNVSGVCPECGTPAALAGSA